jgi:hypothetical protein
LKTLAKQLEDRFESMFAFANALENLVQGISLSDIKPIESWRFPRPTSRIRFGILLGSLAVVVVVSMAIIRNQNQFGKNLFGFWSGTSTPTIIPTKAKLFLADLSPTSVSVGWGNFSVGRFTFSSPSDNIHKGDQIILMGKRYDKGIFAHAPSLITYKIEERFSLLEIIAGKDGDCGNGVVFKITGDDKVIYESELSPSYPFAEKLSLDISGVREIRLIADAGPGRDIDCDEVIWGDPMLIE